MLKNCDNPEPKFVAEEDRFISGTGIDRIKTIEEKGYDPIVLPSRSGREIWCVCLGCGKYRLILRDGYHDLCNSCSKKGDRASNWQGGISFEPYCPKFNEKLKHQIRNQYNNCDYFSGVHYSICNILKGRIFNLSIHHVDYDKTQGCNGVGWKLIPLSSFNHAKVHRNRPFWNKLICYALEYDETYYDEEIIDIFTN